MKVLVDMRHPFYSPDLGRFMQADPIGFAGGDNLYAFVSNHPTIGTDPFGLEEEEETSDLGGGGPASGFSGFTPGQIYSSENGNYTALDSISIGKREADVGHCPIGSGIRFDRVSLLTITPR